MTAYRAPLRDHRFVLHELLRVERYRNVPTFADTVRETIDAVLEEGGRMAEEVLFPLNRGGDEEGCRFEGRHRHDAARVRGRLADLSRGGLDRPRRQSGVRRRRAAASRRRRAWPR